MVQQVSGTSSGRGVKARNEPIGEVECPHKGCTEIAKVFRFRPRGAPERKTVFTGKLYCECPKHGRAGADGNSTVNEYLLEHAKIWEPSKGPGASADASRKNTPAAATPATSKTEQPAAASTGSSGSRWRPLLDLE